MKKKKLRLYSVEFILLGILCFVIFTSTFFLIPENLKYQQVKEKLYIPTYAKVISYHRTNDFEFEDNRIFDTAKYAVIIEYEVNGEIYKKQSDKHVRNPDKIGTILDIRYHPDNPEDILWKYNYIKNHLKLKRLIFSISGSICILIGIIFEIMSYHKNSKRKKETKKVLK